MTAFAGNSGKQQTKLRTPRKAGPPLAQRGRPFRRNQPGKAPDPRINRLGRPKDYAEFQLRVQELGEADALIALLDLMNSAVKDGDRLRAIELVLAYSRGKPLQALEVTGKHGAALVPQSDPSTGECQDRCRFI